MMMKLHLGIAEYLEDWVEQIHQQYKRCIARGKMRSKIMLANSQSRVDKTYHNDKVKEIQQEVKDKSRRIFKNDSDYFLKGKHKKNEKQDARREQQLQAVIEATNLFDETPELLTVIERNLLDNNFDGDALEEINNILI